ncbi:MAG: glycoside hydrolase family 3 C-terminal domain-containing protein, partial [Bacteroidales bacterium]|nr:glycoside hydrolase family 3 C-terminal domain-containing protein [Bacteroidales bacterium]
ETYGEDPYLVSRMGVATVKGYEGDLGSENVLSCTKHLVAGSQSVNGANKAPSDISERTLREVFFPPFEACAKAGSRTYMVAHNEINGVPCHTNKWLMQDVLRGEWGWDGIMVSDWMDIERVFLIHSTADSYKEAFRQAIDAGIDVHMHGIRWQELVCELVREGSISEKRIDQSVRRVLECKFRLGLFEQPYADPEKTMETRLCPEHRATALEAARESIVLMKNNGFLPLDPNVARRVLVTGINADEQGILGDWAAPMADDDVVTILEGLRAAAPKTEFVHIDQGWNPFEMTEAKVEEAARTARGVDLSIVVVSEATMRFRPQRTNGENADRSDNLPFGLQCRLLEKVAQAGKPVILVYTSGRPLSIPWTKQSDSVPAIINAWEPGMYGGQAVAEVIYGIINPSGKLPVTIAESTAQVLNVYNHKPSHFFNKYTGSAWEPYYPFGYGLSYTTFRYDNLKLSSETISAKDNLKVSVDITNTGDRDGVEIAQLYIRDCYSQVSRPVKELKGFRRCALTPGQTATV